jgi:hypothetical protein
MATHAEILARLRDASDGGPSARLASLLVDDVLRMPVAELLDPAAVASALRDVLQLLTASDEAALRVVGRLEAVRVRVAARPRGVGEDIPPALREGMRTFVQLPLVPRREVVLKLLDRQALKQAVRAQLAQTLADFGRRAASPVSDSALARGLGGLGKLAGQIARPSPLGAIASAVSSEVERQVEKRAAEFSDSAVAGVIAGIADQASDPARAAQQAALRLELLEGALSLTGVELGELARGSVEAQVATVRSALAKWVASASFATDIARPLALLVAAEAERPLGALLDDLAIQSAVRAHAVPWVRRGLARLISGDAFAAWLEDLAK